MKQKLLWLHRYLGLILMPFFMLILITGAILAFKPILAPQQGTGFSTDLTSTQIIESINKIDPNKEINTLAVLKNGTSVVIASKNGPSGIYDLQSATRISDAGMSASFYNTVKNLHKELLINADQLVEIVSYLLLFTLIIAPILLWPRLKASLIDVHNILGWSLYPLYILLPLTGILMTFHLGAPDFKKLSTGSKTPIVSALNVINDTKSLNNFISIDNIKGRYQIISLNENNQKITYQLDNNLQLQPINLSRYWVKELHEGTWAGSTSGWINLISALALVILTGSGFYLWLRRAINSRKKEILTDAEILITFASQTGTCAQLAHKSASALRLAGVKTACNPMSTMTPSELTQFKSVLFFISTTGKGDIPDQGKILIKQLDDAKYKDLLSNLNVAIFALGDQSYNDFCAAGHKLNTILINQKTKFILPTEYVSGNPNLVWQKWLSSITQKLGVQLGKLNDFEGDLSCEITLIDALRLDVPEAKMRETWRLRFKPQAKLIFHPGDLLLITPKKGEKPRPYSVGSSSLTQHFIEITVGLESYLNKDNSICFGQCSDYLCHQLEVGSKIHAQLRYNPEFNPPENNNQKIILIATGTGIAPFTGFIEERAIHKNLNTCLFYGCGKKNGDFLHAERFESWSKQGILKLTTAFSFDPDDGQFIQHKIIENAHLIYEWITQNHAIIYVCGRSSTVGDGTLMALAEIFKRCVPNTTNDDAKTWVNDLLNKRQLRMDLFG